MTIDSSRTGPDIFDAPTRRSTKMIGTSPTRPPCRATSKTVSTVNA